MRTLLAQVDADGEWNAAWIEKLLYLLRKHPSVKFTVGVIVCYFDGTLRVEDLEERLSLIREVLRLPNVEPASHSWSHPMNWADPSGGINLVGARVLDPVKEIHYSTDFIEQRLTDKKVKVYELTGDCNPSPECLKMICDRGLYAFNGYMYEDAPYVEIEGCRQYAQRAWADVWHTGLRKWRVEDGRSVAYVDQPQGYKKVLSYFAEHPERPVHVYAHVYCAEFRPTFGSVDYVLTEVEKWGLEPLFLSEYADKLKPQPLF